MSTFSFMENEANQEFGDGLNLLDEFLDQRVYETPGGLASELKPDLMEDNLGLDFDMNMYKGSPEWQSAIQTAFHSPEESYYSTGNALASNQGGVTPPEAETGNISSSSSKLLDTAPQTPANRNTSSNPAGFNNLPRSNGTKSNGMFMKSDDLSPDSYDVSKASVLSHTASNSDAENSNNPASTDSNYDHARSHLAKLKFGNPVMKSCPNTTVPEPSYLDFSESAMQALPYKLSISNVPTFLRVETQIKLRVSMSPAPTQYLLHVPQDVISKNKFCLKDPIESLTQQIGDKLLYLDVFVMTSNLQKSCTICSRCIRREQKRALRRKSGAFEDDESLKNNTLWSDENMNKKAIIFNCKEVVSFPPPNGLVGDHKLMELSARIVCYCRHHLEPSGFKLLFVVKDYLGNVVAKEVLTPIMIMDRKKTSGNTNNLSGIVQTSESTAASSSALINKENNLNDLQPSKDNSPMHPISPNSIDDLSEPTNTDTNDERGLKRKKLSVDDSLNPLNLMFNGINFLPISNSDTNASTHNYFVKPTFQQPSIQQQQVLAGPSIQRIIPAEGPIRGGIAVTLLGFNFRTGLRVKFGSNQALATHCWSETTIVTYLPPASQPGQVLVSFEGENMIPDQELVFTYTDDTDRQLIELALQIVGLKMNGKLEDAKNIARRIVGTDVGNGGNAGTRNGVAGGQTRGNGNQLALSPSEMENWFEKAQQTAKKLTRSDLSSEDLLIQLLSLVDLPNCPLTFLNWLLPNQEGQLLLHLAALKNHRNLVNFLITRGCKVDTPDNLGLSPLFYASLCGHRELINTFLDCRANYNLKLSNNLVLTDYCDLNVMDIFLDLSEIEEVGGPVNKSKSVDSLYLMFARSYGRHVLKMVDEGQVEASSGNEIEAILDGYEEDESDFADSEGESEPEIATKYEVEASRTMETESMDHQVGDVNVNSSIWQRVKSAFTNEDDDVELPSYDDLFPFGHTAKPEVVDLESPSTSASSKTIEAGVSEYDSGVSLSALHEEDGITSDSSEDIVFSRKFQLRRKTVKNDKMLLFFWFPVLMIILLLFIFSSLGHKFEFIESLKDFVRVTIGNVMLGNERLIRVFKPDTVAEVAPIL